jgi:hypothetical protein
MGTVYEYEGWNHSTSGEQDVAIEGRIGDLKEGILEAETLLAEGHTDWCSGDPKECLASMKRELAELEWL